MLARGAEPEAGWACTIHAMLGDVDTAIRALEEILDDRSWRIFYLWRSLVFYLKVGPWFDNLRDDPRFDRLLDKLNMADGEESRRGGLSGEPH